MSTSTSVSSATTLTYNLEQLSPAHTGQSQCQHHQHYGGQYDHYPQDNYSAVRLTRFYSFHYLKILADSCMLPYLDEILC